MTKGTVKKDPRHQNLKIKKQVEENKYADLIGLGIIILLGIIIYSNSFMCSFHFDDIPRIVDNPTIRNLADVKAWWNYYPARPVGIFTFVLNYHFNHLDVRYWHLVNLIIHLLNACLVWRLTLLIFSSPALKDNPIFGRKKVVAFFTALLFVSHPLATQSVTYIVQRLSSMAAMFYLLTLVLYMQARLSDKRNTFKTILFAGSFISAVLAMFTKENSFTIPFAILFFEIFFLRGKRISISFKDWRVIVMTVAFLGILLIIPVRYSFSVFKPIPPSNGNPYTVTSLNYLFTQFSVITKYIQLLFLPINQNVDYDFPISTNFFGVRTLLSFLILLSLIIVGIITYKRNRIISFGIFWFFLTLSIESGFIPIGDLIFEHRTYLPSFGFFLVFSTVIFGLLKSRYRVLTTVIMVIIVIVNSYLTYERNKVWKDDLTLWNDNVSKSPDKAGPYINRGVAYGKLGQWDKSTADYTKAIGINPNYAKPYGNRGINYANLGQWDKAIVDCSRAIELDPKYIDAYYNRGVAYSNLGNREKSIADYSTAITIDPKYARAYYNRAIDYWNLGQWDKSIADCSKVIEISPDYTAAYYNRGVDWGNLGLWDKAIADYTKAIGINPDFAMAYNARGIAYDNLGQLENAVADFSRAIAIDPNFTKAYTNRDAVYNKLNGMKKQ